VSILSVRNEDTLLREKWDLALPRIGKNVTLLRAKGFGAILRVTKKSRY
jgi:hypothetical protein